MARMFLVQLFAGVFGLVAVLAGLTLHPSAAVAQRSPLADGELCPSRMYTGRDDLTCYCGKTEGGASVWGTDVYTDDSMLCHAALHGGAIGESGGVIHVRRTLGQDSYTGSTRNGFTSMSYGSYGSSIMFDSSQAVNRSLGGLPLCPVLYNAAPTDWEGDCQCEPGRSGPVWGSDPYTSDSAVCSAAVHAGLIGRAGGVIHLAPAPGQRRYIGSTRNGFTTSDYGQWGSSFTVSAGASQ